MAFSAKSWSVGVIGVRVPDFVGTTIIDTGLNTQADYSLMNIGIPPDNQCEQALALGGCHHVSDGLVHGSHHPACHRLPYAASGWELIQLAHGFFGGQPWCVISSRI